MSAAAASGRTARVEAQAKINLFLRILSREPGGYHQLSTLFQRVALADSITVRTGGAGRSLDCRGADVGPVERNLAWRAAVAFAEASGGPATFSIEIDKRIPVGGGLGGGSADAAAVLRALNALADPPLGEAALGEIAGALGADVPYLLSMHALALGAGHGDLLHPLEALPPREVVLAVPPFGVSSAEAFGWFAERHGSRRPAAPATVPVGPTLEWRAIAALAANDLEGVVVARHPEIAVLRDALRRDGAILAQMSGSGSTVFGVFGTAPASDAVGALTSLGARVIRTSTVERVAPVELG